LKKKMKQQRQSPTPIAMAVAMAMLSMSAASHAQQAAPAPDESVMNKVEITGSSIKRAAADQSLPVTIVKADDWIAQGVVTIDDMLMSMSTASDYQPSTNAGNGNSANMRGIGQSRTLMLLDGKRLSDGPIDPNTIPISALDRTEVLRDGASSVYGSDAIGGVINFVTKKSYSGAALTVKAAVPEHSGGGESTGFNFIAGKGKLGSDGWNVYVTGDLNRQFPLDQDSRPNITGIERRLSAGFAAPKLVTGSNAVPANVTLANGSSKVGSLSIVGNPYAASGCLPEFSTPGLSNTCVGLATANNLTLTAARQQASFFTKGSLMLGADHKLSVSLMYSSIYVRPVKSPTSGVDASISDFPALTITPSSPYYPGKGITPAMPGITNQTLTLAWSLIGDLGPTILNYDKSQSRVTIDEEGRAGVWDYKIGIWNAVYATNNTFRAGFVNSYKLLAGVAGGQLNPFGLQNADGKAYLKSISTDGETASKSLTRMSGADLSLSRELMELPGGSLALATGAGIYHDYAYANIPPSVALSGGQTGTTAATNQAASRNVAAVYAELDAPLTKTLNVNLALRTDRYNDFGSSTNPKLSLRFRPIQSVMLRGAIGTGFRAPTLNERYFGAVNGPTGVTSVAYNDPLLCPGGALGAHAGGTALPGYTPTTVCNAKLPVNAGANPNVGPEKSKTVSFGVVLTPTPSLLVSVDYFKVDMSEAIGQLAQATLFNGQYTNLFVRNPANNMLLYIDDRLTNLGGQRTDGVDLTTSYTLPKTSWGRFGVEFDGTYVRHFETQVSPDGPWLSSINVFGPLDGNVMTFRWKYAASVKWNSSNGNWTSTLNQQYKQSFQDLNTNSTFVHRIDPYTLYNWSMSYTGFQKWKLMAGVNNLLNRDPPAANYRGEGFASGTASPLGRTWNARATYTF
jgi:iron complex outermembrane receptor protein